MDHQAETTWRPKFEKIENKNTNSISCKVLTKCVALKSSLKGF